MPNNNPPLCPNCKKPMNLWMEFKDNKGQDPLQPRRYKCEECGKLQTEVD